MKLHQIFSLLFLFAGISLSCQAENSAVQLSSGEDQVIEAYYFHTNRRCGGCRLVESEFEKAVKELYGEQVVFEAHNLDTPEGKAFASEKGVGAQAAMIYVADQQVNVTGDCFRNARNPEALRKVLQQRIDPLL
jgi:thiol-disulfide isomerase/thioredoxin